MGLVGLVLSDVVYLLEVGRLVFEVDDRLVFWVGHRMRMVFLVDRMMHHLVVCHGLLHQIN